jgi:Zn finger protein HypA/HybF involved in hydrogenase expression
MAILLNCPNSYTDDKGKQKKCGSVEVYMDPKTEKVYCPLCEEEMIVNHFTKITLKSIKQFKQKSTATFVVKCQSCHKEAQPVINNNKIVCPFCQKEHTHLSEPFKIMLKDRLKTVNKDIA